MISLPRVVELRRNEVRHPVASAGLSTYCDWAGLAQVFQLVRTWREHGVAKRALYHGITTLPPDRAARAHR